MSHSTCRNTVVIFSDDYDDRRREFHETPEEKIRTAIIKLGEVVGVSFFKQYNGFHSLLGRTGGAAAAREANTRTCSSKHPKPLRVISNKVCRYLCESANAPNTNAALQNSRTRSHFMPL